MTNKKQKLFIPENMIRWVRTELTERNGEIFDMWDDALNDLGWLEDVKESKLIPFHKAAPLMKVGDKFEPESTNSFAKILPFELCKDDRGDPFFKTGKLKMVTLSPDHFNLMGEIIRADSKDPVEILKEHSKLSEMSLINKKEPKLMTLQEAAKLCTKKGDKVHSADGEHSILFENFAYGMFTVHQLLKLKEWYFVPSEPKVYSEEEIFQSYHSFVIDNKFDEEQILDFKDLIRVSIESGKLKQWLNHKELREAVIHWISATKERKGVYFGSDLLKEAIKNLKPLNPE